MEASRQVSFWGSHKTLHIVLGILTLGLWLAVPFAIYLWRRGKKGWSVVTSVAAGLLLVGLISAGANPSSSDTTTSAQETTITQETHVTETEGTANESSSTCVRFANNVENYDILLEGASRAEYLTLLHKLQRDCPQEALKRGLTAEGLPQCQQMDQENCTMYEG